MIVNVHLLSYINLNLQRINVFFRVRVKTNLRG